MGVEIETEEEMMIYETLMNNDKNIKTFQNNNNLNKYHSFAQNFLFKSQKICKDR